MSGRHQPTEGADSPERWVCGSCQWPRMPGDGPPLRQGLFRDLRSGRCAHCKKDRTFTLAPAPRPAAPPPDHGQARRTDPPTSHAAARQVRTGSAKAALLLAHANHPDGLTDEEAARIAGLSLASEYATRCSELMRAGYLADTTATRIGEAGMHRLVRRITAEGRKVVTG